MAITLTEKELKKYGLMITESDPQVLVPVNRTLGQQLDESWELEDLAHYAVATLAQSQDLRAQAQQLTRKSTVFLYRAGHALSLAKKRMKSSKQWCDWQRQYSIPRSSAWYAVALYEKAGSEQEVEGLSRQAALAKFGIEKPKKKKDEGKSQNCVLTPNAQSDQKAEDNSSDAVQKSTRPRRSGPSSTTTSPPKENPKAVLLILNALRSQLEYCREDLSKIDWSTESSEDYREAIDLILSLSYEIQERIPHSCSD